MTTLYLCGAGNIEGVRLALNINRAYDRWNRIVILDDNPAKHGESILGVKISGPFTVLDQADQLSSEVSNMVARTTRVRHSALRKIQGYGLPFASLIHPGVDTTGVDYGQDITVYPNAQLCANASVGEGSVALMGSILGHGCRVGRGCIVAPGAVINARVELGDGVYVGTNASIMPDLKIGPWVTIGANSSVVQDVPAGATVMGVPGQILMINGAKVSGLSSGGPVNERRETERSYQLAKHLPNVTDIRSEALKKLRFAQEKFIAACRSPKS